MEAYQYSNQLPELPADPLLPKFVIPEISFEIMDTPIYNELKTNLTPDPFLGVPVEFTDLSVYNKVPTVDDYTQEDNEYMHQGSTQLTGRMQTETLPHTRTTKVETRSEQTQKVTSSYRRGEIITSDNYDEEIQENLKRAFKDNIPPGRAYLLKEEPPLSKLQTQRTAYKFTNTNFLFEAGTDAKEKFIKEIPENGGAPISGFAVTAAEYPYAYIVFNDDDGTASFGYSPVEYQLNMMVPRDLKSNELTARPVKFEE